MKKLYRNLLDRKSTRLNSSHGYISYAVFCLKKKKKIKIILIHSIYIFFFFNVPATTKNYILSLHDALPIYKNSFLYNLQFGIESMCYNIEQILQLTIRFIIFL